MASTLTADLDTELQRIAIQWRHAELHGWYETAEAHRQRLDLPLDAMPTQRSETCA